MQIRYLALLPMLATAALLSPLTRAQVPVFAVTPVESAIKFNVTAAATLTFTSPDATVPIAGNFDKWDCEMNSGIPFIKIADHVEVDIALKAKQVSGPRLVYQQ
jgi:hypothetical protein